MKHKFHEENSRTVLAVYALEQAESKQLPQYLAAGLASLGAFAAGTCLSWSSPALPLLERDGAQPRLTTEEGSWVSSLITLGAFAGAMPAGWLADKIGRKKTLQLLALPIIVSWLLIAFSCSVWGLYAARLLAGLAVGAFSVATPMYVAELAEPRIRGTLGTFFQLQITLGILFEYLTGLTEDFLQIALLSLAVPILFLGAFSFMPESPVFLMGQDQVINARRSLQWLRGSEYDIQDEMTRIKDQIQESRAKKKASLSDVVDGRANAMAMIISLGLMTFQQLSGVNAVIFYAGKIFEGAGSRMPPTLSAIIIGTVMVLATYSSTILVDRAGRRILLIISASVMSLCVFALAIFFHLKETGVDVACYSSAPLLSVAVFIVVFSIGFGPIPWMMLGEIFSPRVKGTASSIAAAFNWMLAFTVTKLFQNMQEAMGTGLTFGVFAIVSAVGTGFVCLCVPETKGKDIEDIQRELGGVVDHGRASDSDSDDNIVTIHVKS